MFEANPNLEDQSMVILAQRCSISKNEDQFLLKYEGKTAKEQ